MQRNLTYFLGLGSQLANPKVLIMRQRTVLLQLLTLTNISAL